MEQKKERKWHLVRNNNGEWISSEQVVYLDDFSAMSYKLQARQNKLSLTPQTYNGETWYYKYEIEAIKATMDVQSKKTELRKLKVAPAKCKLTEMEIIENNIHMLKQKTNGHFDALNEDFPLWKKLEYDSWQSPQWWKNLLNDKELYVEIRKDNYVNVYYYGGNLALVRWIGADITAETHKKYLGQPDSTTTYLNCMEILQDKEKINCLKERIREEYHKLTSRAETDKRNSVYISNEKWVQGELKLHFPNRYIDSEFAYQIGKKELIRFDLVELRGKQLVFVELKLITDSRLRCQEGEPEIIEQMTDYCDFIRNNAEKLKEYYSKLLRIKKRLGLWKGDTQIDEVNLKPELLIVNTYNKLTSGREKRIDYIEKLKERTEFNTFVVDYLHLCE